MSETLSDSKVNHQIKQFLEEPHKDKKIQNQESLNTKNFIKRMTTSKKPQPNQKAQTKITAFMNLSNSTSYGGQKEQIKANSFIIDPNQQRIKEIQQRMKQKDLQIQKMKKSKQIDQNRYSLLVRQTRQNKKKSREAIAKSMLQAAQFRRAERRQINPKLGYFKDGVRTFVQGAILTNLRKKIKQKSDLIKQLEEDKKNKDLQKKQIALFKIDFIQKVRLSLKKEILGLQRQLQNTDQYVNSYKQTLKIADKQSNCQYSLQGWPIVYDNFQSLELLGKGGFGQVYKCYDLQNNQIVALRQTALTKILPINKILQNMSIERLKQ